MSKLSDSIDIISSKINIIKSEPDKTLLQNGIAEKKIDDFSGRLNNLEVKVAKIENYSVERERNSRVLS